MSDRKETEEELINAHIANNRLRAEIEQRNKTEILIVAGVIGLATYLLLGMSITAAFLGIGVFVGISIWKKAFF